MLIDRAKIWTCADPGSFALNSYAWSLGPVNLCIGSIWNCHYEENREEVQRSFMKLGTTLSNGSTN